MKVLQEMSLLKNKNWKNIYKTKNTNNIGNNKCNFLGQIHLKYNKNAISR